MSWSSSANEHFGCDWAELLRTGCVTKPLFLWRLNNMFHCSTAENAEETKLSHCLSFSCLCMQICECVAPTDTQITEQCKNLP